MHRPARFHRIIAVCALALTAATTASDHARAEGAEEPTTARKPRADPLIAAGAARVHVIERLAFAARTELRRARQAHDGPAIACTNASLTQLHAAARAGRARLDELRAGVAATDDRAASLAVERLERLESRAHVLRAEARACLERNVWGERDGTTRVRVIRPSLPMPSDPPRFQPPQ